MLLRSASFFELVARSRYGALTCRNPGPPQGIPEVYEAISLETIPFPCLVEALVRHCQLSCSVLRLWSHRWALEFWVSDSRVQVWSYLFGYDETGACAAKRRQSQCFRAEHGNRSNAPIPMAKLDVMANPRPIYLQRTPWSAHKSNTDQPRTSQSGGGTLAVAPGVPYFSSNIIL